LAALTVILVLVVAGLAAGWWFFIREDAELATEAPEIPEDLRSPARAASATTTAEDNESPSPQATRTQPVAGGTTAFTVVSERSEAAYFAGETLARVGVPSTAKGLTNEVTGTYYLTETGLDPGQESSFLVDLRNLDSGQSQRDNRVQQTLETGTYPTATFVAESLEGFPAQLLVDEDSTFFMTGPLTVHGVTKVVTWEVKARRDGTIMTALATVTVRYDDFGMEPPNIAGIVSVEDDLTLQMQIVATAAED
jgi:polyisoprenoid-binding protein YceI